MFIPTVYNWQVIPKLMLDLKNLRMGSDQKRYPGLKAHVERDPIPTSLATMGNSPPSNTVHSISGHSMKNSNQ